MDFYSGILMRAMGIPTSMFTVIFAIGRMPGWIAHWKEQHDKPGGRIARPRQVYTGPRETSYIPIDRADHLPGGGASHWPLDLPTPATPLWLGRGFLLQQEDEVVAPRELMGDGPSVFEIPGEALAFLVVERLGLDLLQRAVQDDKAVHDRPSEP